MASICRADILLALIGQRFHEMGPWQDSMGMSVAAWKRGVVYLGRTFGAKTLRADGYNDVSVANSEASIRHFEAVSKFLKAFPEVPDVLKRNLAGKVFRTLPPEVQRQFAKGGTNVVA